MMDDNEIREEEEEDRESSEESVGSSDMTVPMDSELFLSEDDIKALCDKEAFDLFKTACNDSSAQVRLTAISRVKLVAIGIGEERTRKELIPYLKSLAEDDTVNDELLEEMTAHVNSLLDAMGGLPYIDILLDLLRVLASSDEYLVRVKAESSLSLLASVHLDQFTLETMFVPLVLDLAKAEQFGAKITAAGLLGICYRRVGSENCRAQLRDAGDQLYHDESPLVRKAAAARFLTLVDYLSEEYVRSDVLRAFKHLAQEEQSGVRVVAVDVGLRLASRVDREFVETHLADTLIRLSKDQTWEVRRKVAENIGALATHLGYRLSRSHLMDAFTALIGDDSPRVRATAAARVADLGRVLNAQHASKSGNDGEFLFDSFIIDRLVPLIYEAYRDEEEQVKESLMDALVDLSPILGPVHSGTYLLPLVSDMLTDRSWKFKESAVAVLNRLIQVVGASETSEVTISVLAELMNSSSRAWRTMRHIALTIANLALSKDAEYFETKLRSTYLLLLKNNVYAVRATTPLVLPLLTKKFGPTWATESLVPYVVLFAEEPRYLYRYVFLFCLDELVAPTLDSDFTVTEGIRSFGLILDQLFKFKCHEDDPTRLQYSTKLLDEIKDLSERLVEKFEEEWVLECLELMWENGDLDDIPKLYMDGMHQEYNTQKKVLTAITYDELTCTSECYIKGVLEIILNHAWESLRKLSTDPVQNVKIRTSRTLLKIMVLSEQLQQELDPSAMEASIDKHRSTRMELTHGNVRILKRGTSLDDAIPGPSTSHQPSTSKPRTPPEPAETTPPCEDIGTELMKILKEKLLTISPMSDESCSTENQ